MDNLTRWFTQDVDEPIHVRHGGGLVFTGDAGAPVVGVHMMKNGAPAALPGSVSATVIRPDGTTVPIASGVISGGDVSVALTAACFTVPGPIGVAITLSGSGVTMTVLKAVFSVEPTATGTIIDPAGTVALTVADLVADIDAATATIPASYADLMAAIAPTFDGSTAYKAGAYVWHAGDLYRFGVDHTGTWDSNDVKKVAVADDLRQLITSVRANLYPAPRILPSGRPDPDLFTDRGVAWVQGNYTPGNGETDSITVIRTPWFSNSGGVLIYNPGGTRQYALYKKTAGGVEELYDPNNIWYSVETLYVPADPDIVSLRMKQRIAGTGGRITPEDSWVSVFDNTQTLSVIDKTARLQQDGVLYADGKALRPAGVAFERGRFTSSSDSYSWYYIRTGWFTGDVYIHNPDRLAFAVLRNDSTGNHYVAFTSAVSGATNFYDDALGHLPPLADASYRIMVRDYRNGTNYEITPESSTLTLLSPIPPNEVFGYERTYTDITYSLQWAHKTFDANGNMIDSDYNIMAEIPNVGNVEVKMNRPEIKFAVYSLHGRPGGVDFTRLTTNPNQPDDENNDGFTHYFCRVTPDDNNSLHYYVVVADQDGGQTTSSNFTIGRRGIKVYTYEDYGVKYKRYNNFYGKRTAVLGDSIVQGRFSKNVGGQSTNAVMAQPWPVLIAKRLNTEPGDFGIGGAKVAGTAWLSLETNKDVIKGYDVVFVCAGTNDFKESNTYTDPDTFETAYKAVLQALKDNNPNGTIIAVTPTPRRTNTQNGGGFYLSDYVAKVKTAAAAKSVPVIDLYAMTESDPVFIGTLADGIHPNEVGQMIIAEHVLEAAQWLV